MLYTVSPEVINLDKMKIFLGFSSSTTIQAYPENLSCLNKLVSDPQETPNEILRVKQFFSCFSINWVHHFWRWNFLSWHPNHFNYTISGIYTVSRCGQNKKCIFGTRNIFWNQGPRTHTSHMIWCGEILIHKSALFSAESVKYGPRDSFLEII